MSSPAPASATRSVGELHGAHYGVLIRQAAAVLRDRAAAEDVVQEAFAGLLAAWPRLRDHGRALAYLRASVANGATSALRHLTTARRVPMEPPGRAPAAEHEAMAALERDAVLAALRKLPARQRQVIALRYYGDLSEAQIAQHMGIAAGTVKAHAAKALACLRRDWPR